MHWTQDPKNKRRVMEMSIRSAATRKRMALAQERMKQARGREAREETAPLKGKALAKQELADLARRGAEVKLRELERECDKLRMFLGLGGEK